MTNRAAHAGRYEADTRGDHRTRQQVLSESDQELGVDGTGEQGASEPLGGPEKRAENIKKEL